MCNRNLLQLKTLCTCIYQTKIDDLCIGINIFCLIVLICSMEKNKLKKTLYTMYVMTFNMSFKFH